MNVYLVTFKELPDDGESVRCGNLDNTVRFLKDNIIEEHYSSTGYIIESIHRFDGSDKLTLMELVRVYTRTSPDDYTDHHYALAEPGGMKWDAEFAVRIDGRA